MDGAGSRLIKPKRKVIHHVEENNSHFIACRGTRGTLCLKRGGPMLRKSRYPIRASELLRGRARIQPVCRCSSAVLSAGRIPWIGVRSSSCISERKLLHRSTMLSGEKLKPASGRTPDKRPCQGTLRNSHFFGFNHEQTCGSPECSTRCSVGVFITAMLPGECPAPGGAISGIIP